MTLDEKTMIESTLKQYGASLTPDGAIISPKGNKMTVRPIIKKNRIRFEGGGLTVMTASVTPQSIETFVEKYWLWSKLNDA